MSAKQKKVLYRIIVTLALMVFAVCAESFMKLPYSVVAVMYLVPYAVIGCDILRKAFKGILKKQIFDENFLMAVATVGAVALGEFKEAVAVMLFYQIGELFQSVAVGKSRRSIAALMDIRPDYANVMLDGKLTQVDPACVGVGSEIVVAVGEKVPLDGVIVRGSTTLNTSALTGESVPTEAEVGDEVFSGSLNMTGVVTLKTTKDFGQSTASKILELVEQSAHAKAKTERFITRFARVYTPFVCFAAAALAFFVPAVRALCGYDAQFYVWLHRALSFLVVSCPCALVISVPLGFFGGVGCASSKGVLIKGAVFMETLAKAKTVIFDKTGTLTKGSFEVSDIKAGEGFSDDELLEMCAYAESASNHPVAISIVKAFKKPLDLSRVTDIKELAGHGVSAVFDGKNVLCGNIKLMEKSGVECKEQDCAGTLIYVACDTRLAGVICVSDRVKPASKSALDKLRALGVSRIAMLTGDNKNAAEKIAYKLGVTEVYSELMPVNKVEITERIIGEKQQGSSVVFVGDGINDAPVLTRADVGIAMGALGSDAAIEAADVVLMDDDPQKVALAVRISRKTLGIVRQNIVFSLAVKLVCLLLTALGIFGMWLAIFADVGVMVIAVLNSARALKIK